MPYASKVLTDFVEVLESLGEGLIAFRDGVFYTLGKVPRGEVAGTKYHVFTLNLC